ncbi:MAG: helix-turn-helix transcriptional regulator [Verrucomicrobiota bacterium]
MPNKAKDQARLKVFGANIRRARLSKGITQEKLAELADITTRNLQKVEAGGLNILVTTAMRIQRGLRVPWKNLMTRL